MCLPAHTFSFALQGRTLKLESIPFYHTTTCIGWPHDPTTLFKLQSYQLSNLKEDIAGFTVQYYIVTNLSETRTLVPHLSEGRRTRNIVAYLQSSSPCCPRAAASLLYWLLFSAAASACWDFVSLWCPRMNVRDNFLLYCFELQLGWCQNVWGDEKFESLEVALWNFKTWVLLSCNNKNQPFFLNFVLRFSQWPKWGNWNLNCCGHGLFFFNVMFKC